MNGLWTSKSATILVFAVVVAVALGFAGSTPGSASAASSLVTFHDRTNWSSVVGGADWFVDFENFANDAVFGLAPVDAGPFTLTQTSGLANLFNRVDVPPYFAGIAPLDSPNGSTFAMAVIGNSSIVGNNQVEITFDQPVTAFGADFRSGDGSNFLVNQLVLNTASGPTTTSIDTTDGFFGFTSSESFTSITFQANAAVPEVAAAFGMDNVVAKALVSDTTAPVISVPGPITVNATSPTGAVVTYSVSATDPDDAVATLSCVPASGSTFPIGTTTVTCTATDTHGNLSTASFTVHVEGVAEQLSDLLTAVTGIGPGTSLADKVSQAQGYIAANDVADACSTLKAFINEVAAQSGVTLTSSQAAPLIATARRIEAVLGC